MDCYVSINQGSEHLSLQLNVVLKTKYFLWQQNYKHRG